MLRYGKDKYLLKVTLFFGIFFLSLCYLKKIIDIVYSTDSCMRGRPCLKPQRETHNLRIFSNLRTRGSY